MKSFTLGLAGLLLAAGAGCGNGSREAAYYEGEQIQLDFSDPGEKAIKDELAKLPMRDVAWQYKLTDSKISRMTLGSETLYIETPDHIVIAMDRFSGVMKWMHEVDTRTPLDWAPVEAAGVADEIRSHEASLRAAQRKLGDIVKEKGPGPEQREQQKKVDQFRELLLQAQAGDSVYIVSRSILYCLVRTTGTVLWQRQLTLEFSPGGPPFAIRSDVFIPSSNMARVWRLSVPQRGSSVKFYPTSIGSHEKFVTARPTFSNPSLYFVSHDGNVYCYDQAGSQTWVRPTGDELRADPILHRYVRSFTDADGKPRPLDRQFLFIGGMDNAFYALDAATGKIEWKYEAAGQIKTPAVVKDDTVYVKTEGGALFALEVAPMHRDSKGKFMVPRAGEEFPWRRSGQLRWKLPLGERFVVKNARGVYVLGADHELYGMNEMSGEVIYRHELKHLQHLVTNPIDDLVYVASPAGYIYALRESRD